MESSDIITVKSSNDGFIGHVFNFNKESKEEILNIVQYTALALIPIICLNKTMKRFVPEADDNKGSIEIIIEVLLQLIFIFIGILITHRLITYIPTQSGAPYSKLDVTNIILAVLIIILTIQSKLGDKITILSERVLGFYDTSPPLNTRRKEGMSTKQNMLRTQDSKKKIENGAPPPQQQIIPTDHLSASNDYPSETYASFQ